MTPTGSMTGSVRVTLVTVAGEVDEAGRRPAPSRGGWERRLRLDSDLEDAVQPVAEDPVGLVDLGQREAMGEQRRRVEPARTDHGDQPTHPLLATWAKRRDDPVVAEARRERLVRHLQLARVDAKARQRAAGPEAAQRAFECRLGPERLDRDVGAVTARQPLDLLDDIDLRE